MSSWAQVSDALANRLDFIRLKIHSWRFDIRTEILNLLQTLRPHAESMSFQSMDILDLLFAFDQNEKLLENALLRFIWLIGLIGENLINNCKLIVGVIKRINHLAVDGIAFGLEFICEQVWVLIQFEFHELLLQVLIVNYWQIGDDQETDFQVGQFPLFHTLIVGF